MKIIREFSDLTFSKPLVATIGMFDGVHLGHQKLLEYVCEISKKMQGESALFSFDQHPRLVLYNDDNLQLLTPNEEKIQRLEKTQIENYIPLPFTKEFAQLTAFEFVRDILVNQFNIKYLIVGHDHHFGKNREGNFEQLKEYAAMFDFKVKQFAAVDFDDLVISSTKIRNALNEGKVHQANAMLGYEYTLSGTVVEGKAKGRLLGFPTANIEVLPYKLIPQNGVYIAEAEIKNHFYEAMVNIGRQPTLDGKHQQIEAHLLHFNEDIYKEELSIRLKKYLRPEQKFESQEALITQIKKDQEATEKYFNLL